MVRRSRTLTAFGKDLDSLLKQAGKFNLREYADECGVSYKYISQLRTMPNRRPGGLYASLLKPFTRLQIVDLAESHQLSLRHRDKPLSLSECNELFPDIPDQDLLESIKQAVEIKNWKESTTEPTSTYIETDSSKSVEPGFLYRRVFVGREAELGQLQSAFDNAMSGNGSIVMVVGEPGIGKTALCNQLSTYVALRGGLTLTGHCYEEESLSLPYLAFVEAIRSYIVTSQVDELRQYLAAGAADVARIVPEIRQRLSIEPRSPGDPQEERYRLMQAVIDFLTNFAKNQPLLVVLEDLHDADQGTLDMLTYALRNLAGARLLIIGTYRDVEVDRAHSLSSILAELHSASASDRLLLRGLNIDEVIRMLNNITGEQVPRSLAEVIHRQTEGNPLFVQEVIRYLIEEGLVKHEGGSWQLAGQTPQEMSIPEGLRDVIGKRLSSLSTECKRLLVAAAVIGREFLLEVLQRINAVSDEELFSALEEAKRLFIIEEHYFMGSIVTYRFTHSFFRQILYEEIIAPRRIRLHQQIGRVLEDVYVTHLDEHAAELAEHFAHSSDPSDLAKAVSYCEIAAQRAIDVYAYKEATRLLEHALKVQETLDSGNTTRRCDLLLDLAEAVHLTGDYRRVLDELLPEALSLAEAIGDSERASRACDWALNALVTYGASMPELWRMPEAAQWAEHANQHALLDTPARVLADSALGLVKWATGYLRESTLLLGKAVDLGRRLDDAITFWGASYDYFDYVRAPHHTEERLRLAEEMAAAPRPSGSIVRFGGVLFFLVDTFLEVGQRHRAEEIHRELKGHVERSSQAYMLLATMAFDITFAELDGRLEEAVEIGQRMIARGKEFGIPDWAAVQALYRVTRPQLHLGKANEAFQSISGLPLIHPFTESRALCLAHLGQDAEVVEILEQRVFARPDIGSTEDETWAWPDVLLLEAAVLVGQQKAVDLLLRRFSGTGLHTTGLYLTTCVDRHLGAAAALLGKPEEARKHYDEAIRVCTDMRFRPELALTRLQLAELLLEHYPDEKSEALEHLDFAINEFREMKMQPSLEKALRHKEILGA